MANWRWHMSGNTSHDSSYISCRFWRTDCKTYCQTWLIKYDITMGPRGLNIFSNISRAALADWQEGKLISIHSGDFNQIKWGKKNNLTSIQHYLFSKYNVREGINTLYLLLYFGITIETRIEHWNGWNRSIFQYLYNVFFVAILLQISNKIR